MVAHGSTHILQCHLLIGDNPKRHLLGILLNTGSVGHILREIICKAVEEAPHTGLTVTTAREVGLGIGGIIRELCILALKPTHRAGIAHDIVREDDDAFGIEFLSVALSLCHRFGIQQILHLHLHIAAVEELRNTALIGMGSNGIVRNTDSHPDGAALFLRAVRTTTHHLQHPRLVLIGHGERLTLRAIAVLLDERGHHLQGLTGRLGTLKGDIDK